MLTFTYKYQSTGGEVHAVSVAQALDRIKVAYLDRQGIKPGDSRFLRMKATLPQPWRVMLNPTANMRYRTLYRAVKDGDLISVLDKKFFDEYTKAAEDLAVINPNQRSQGAQP